MIKGFSEEEFGKAIHQHVRPSSPIDTLELLKGREKELAEIKRALFATGRHIFIFGDRGIGKSSLAQTAAYQYQSADNAIIQVGCTKISTFLGIMENIAKKLAESLESVEWQTKASLNLKVVTLECGKTEKTSYSTPSVFSMDDALDVISDITEIHSERPVIVIDEFDAIAKEERFLFAEFIKKWATQEYMSP